MNPRPPRPRRTTEQWTSRTAQKRPAEMCPTRKKRRTHRTRPPSVRGAWSTQQVPQTRDVRGAAGESGFLIRRPRWQFTTAFDAGSRMGLRVMRHFGNSTAGEGICEHLNGTLSREVMDHLLV